MTSFAPAFHPPGNNAWLNELIGEIADPTNGATRPRRNTNDEVWEDAVAEQSDYGAVEDDRASTPGLHQGSRMPSHSSLRSRLGALSPWSQRSDSRSRSRSRQPTAHTGPISRIESHQGHHPPPIPEYSDIFCDNKEYMSAPTPDNRQSTQSTEPGSVKAMSAYGDGSRIVSPTDMLGDRLAFSRMPDRSFSSPRPTYPQAARVRNPFLSNNLSRSSTETETYTTKNSEGKLIPRAPVSQSLAPIRSHPHMRSHSLMRTQSTASIASAFTGFPSHPGVRPLDALKEREVLKEAAGPTDEDHEYPGPLPLTLIIIGVTLAVFIISVNRNVVATAIPQITARFHSYGDIGWYGSAYLLTASAFQPMYGRIYMAFDTKWSFLAAVVVFEIGSLICGISPTSDALIIGRAVQGLGSAGILTGAFVVCTHSVRIEMRPVLFAGVGVLYGAGALCGPLLGGVFTDDLSWRWCFYINLPIGLVTFVSVLAFFKPQRHTAGDRPPFWNRVKNLDWIGNAILLGACVQLFLALELSETQYSWSSAPCIGLICGFGVTAILFIAWMFYKGKEALIPVHIAKQRTVAASCGAAFFIYGATLLQSYYLPIWFQAVKGDSAITSGANLVPYMVVNAFFSLFAGIFVSKNGLFAPPAIIGCAIATVGSGLLATVQPDTPTAQWAGYEVLVAAGLGMAIQQGFSAVQTALPLHEVPIGTAAVVASQSAGGAVFVSVGNTLLQNHLYNANQADAIPGVNIRAVIELGATEFRKVIPPEALPALIHLYNRSLQAALIAAVPLCGCAFLCSLCMEWRSVRRKNPNVKDEIEKKIEAIPEMADTATTEPPPTEASAPKTPWRLFSKRAPSRREEQLTRFPSNRKSWGVFCKRMSSDSESQSSEDSH